MAVHRIPVRCNSCAKYVLLRIVIAGGDQPFVVLCPHCQVTQHGNFYARPSESYQFRSPDLSLMNSEPDEDGLAIMVATDMPVHASFQGSPASEVFRSPFIFNSGLLGENPGTVQDLMARIEALRRLHEDWFPSLRKIARQYARQDPAAMLSAFAGTPGGGEVDWSDRDPHEMLDRLLAAFYSPFEDVDLRHAADVELFEQIKQAREVDEAALIRTFRTLREGPLTEHRSRVVDAVISIFDDMDAFYPALWVEALEGHADLSEFRVMRDDFATRKAQYQDIFELASRTLAFIAPIANIASRGNLREYIDGERRNTNQALKETAFKREAWLGDFPVAQKLYSSISRTTRNKFGHALARYDDSRDIVVFDDGRERRYLDFLLDQLSAVRLTHYLMDVLYIFELSESSITAR